MDDIARLPARDRADLLAEAPSRRGNMGPVLIEKDFWVCWTLRRIFRLEALPAGPIFKGGTSLSKVYRAIDRFSEDVDLSFDRVNLGFGGDDDPARASSRKKAEKQIDKLRLACTEMIRNQFLPQLRRSISESLGEEPGLGTWFIELDPDDVEGQTILFRYPSGHGSSGQMAQYVRPVVRLELGARGEHWPAEDASIQCYAAETLPEHFKNPDSRLKVLGAERTFWEKATILHATHHQPLEKPLQPRLSRHYYDLVKLPRAGIGARALANLSLLTSVAEDVTSSCGREKAYVYLQCGRSHNDGRASCPGRRVREDELTPAILETVQNRIFSPTAVDHLVTEVNEMVSQLRGDQGDKLKSLNRQLSEILRKIERQNEMYESGLTDLRTAGGRLKDLGEQRDRLETQIREIEEDTQKQKALYINRDQLHAFRVEMIRIFVEESPQEKREFLRRFIEKIVIEEKLVRIVYLIPNGAVLGRKKGGEKPNPHGGSDVLATIGAWLPVQSLSMKQVLHMEHRFVRSLRCSGKGCRRAFYAKDLCKPHYYRASRGTLEHPVEAVRGSGGRFLAKK